MHWSQCSDILSKIRKFGMLRTIFKLTMQNWGWESKDAIMVSGSSVIIYLFKILFDESSSTSLNEFVGKFCQRSRYMWLKIFHMRHRRNTAQLIMEVNSNESQWKIFKEKEMDHTYYVLFDFCAKPFSLLHASFELLSSCSLCKSPRKIRGWLSCRTVILPYIRGDFAMDLAWTQAVSQISVQQLCCTEF